MKNILLILVSITLLSCASTPKPWEAYSIKTMPDRSCSLSGMTHTNIWIWDCLEGQHITVHQFISGMKTYDAIIEKTKCGKLTYIERENFLDHNFDLKCEEAPNWKMK